MEDRVPQNTLKLGGITEILRGGHTQQSNNKSNKPIEGAITTNLISNNYPSKNQLHQLINKQHQTTRAKSQKGLPSWNPWAPAEKSTFPAQPNVFFRGIWACMVMKVFLVPWPWTQNLPLGSWRTSPGWWRVPSNHQHKTQVVFKVPWI